MSDESAEDRGAFGLDIGEIRHEPRTNHLRLRWYVAAVGLFPFVLIPFSLYWMTTAEYVHHARSTYLSQIGYGAKLRGADCDVVIDGDSTAMVDILPKTITTRTGLSACNIGEVAGVKRITGMAGIDSYLQYNRPPKYILFQFAPENLSDPARWQWGGTFEGVLYGLQFGHKADVMRFFWNVPDAGPINAELGFRTGLVGLLAPLPAAERHSRDDQGGRMPEPGPALTACSEEDDRKEQPQPEWLHKLREQYGSGGTRVLIDVVPLPACDPTLQYYREQLKSGMIDNTVETLPIEVYTGTGRLHMDDEGAQVLSERVAEQIARAQNGER